MVFGNELGVVTSGRKHESEKKNPDSEQEVPIDGAQLNAQFYLRSLFRGIGRTKEPTAGFDPQGNPIRIEVWDRKSSPKPTDPEQLRRTVKLGATGGAYSKRSWYYLRLPLGKSFLAAGLTLAAT